jgi:metallo-beta-lactamase family protein
MTGINEERPWLPADAGEEFDPLAHAGIEPDKDTPIVVTPRGGAREVGRSCYQIDTEHGRYLVDCGLSQGSDETFPDFRGLDPESVDAVFLTHAHIDHCGGLPVLEAKGLLHEDAPIIATPPTISLAKTLLEDSLKIHRRETGAGQTQQFTQQDVDEVFERFEPVDYGGGRVEGLASVPDMEPLVFQLGNAAHLLGSAWLSLQTNGYRVVFSGDLGGRATHLPDITPPPEGDLLISESTYGGLHSHSSMSDARTEVYRAVKRAVESHEPVLIPTFAVGRAQTLQLLFAERLHMLSGDLRDNVRLVVDGMAQEATDIYHEYVQNTDYLDESLANRVAESGQTEPFLPKNVVFPANDAERREVLDNADPAAGGKVPIIVSPSGMLTGGNSPRYLTEFAARYESAKVFLTGYQAANTTGRVLQNHLQADKDEITFETDAGPVGTDWPTSDAVTWTTVERDGGRDRVARATIPADWVEPVDGLSGHAAQHGLLEFARTVGPDTIALVHGPDYAQEALAKHYVQNVEAVDEVTRSRLLTPIEVSRDADVETPALSPEMFDCDDMDTFADQLEHVHELLSALNEEVAVAKENGFDEAQIREIVRDEIEETTADSR